LQKRGWNPVFRGTASVALPNKSEQGRPVLMIGQRDMGLIENFVG
jgi:hypothetical protein